MSLLLTVYVRAASAIDLISGAVLFDLIGSQDVPDYSVVAGNPAKIIRRLKASEMTEPHGSLPKKTKEEIILDDDEAPLPDKS